MSESTARAFTPGQLGPLELRNRVIKAATFEGMSPGGVPGERLRRFHERVARGGVAMSTVAYCTTEADGRINDDMMYLHEGIATELRALTSSI